MAGATHCAAVPGHGVTRTRTGDLILMPNSFIPASRSVRTEPNRSRALLHITRSRPSRATTILTASGEVDHTTVVLDLSHITFLSISGLQAILDADDHARARHRALCLVAGPRCVTRLLEACCPTRLTTALTLLEACMPLTWAAAGSMAHTPS
ncbi:STAS domain-containing protein [Nocardia tengchongensis]